MGESYFERSMLEEKIERLRKTDDCPGWFLNVLRCLINAEKIIPLEEDKNRHTIEYIYPH